MRWFLKNLEFLDIFVHFAFELKSIAVVVNVLIVDLLKSAFTTQDTEMYKYRFKTIYDLNFNREKRKKQI